MKEIKIHQKSVNEILLETSIKESKMNGLKNVMLNSGKGKIKSKED
jgi:hypothetical protein